MSSETADNSRRRFLTLATSAVGAAGAVGIAVPFLGSWNPSAKAKAAGAPVKADVGKLEPGEMVVVEWRGKPVYVVRRTQAMLDDLPNVDPLLKDPDSAISKQPAYITDNTRAIRPELLVVEGLCTHLGCAPKFRPEVGAADLGGDNGTAVSSAPATVPSSTSPGASFPVCRRRRTWSFPPIPSRATASSSSALTRRQPKWATC
jgi:ubiquinol-cytochrome c reductase iron-sulfur subunit